MLFVTDYTAKVIQYFDYAHICAVFFKKKYLLLLEEKINYKVKALCALIFRIRFVFQEAFIIAYASLPKMLTLRFADYSTCTYISEYTQTLR